MRYVPIIFSFDYLSKDDQVTNVIVQTPGGDRTISNKFDIVFLDDIVLKVYEEETEN